MQTRPIRGCAQEPADIHVPNQRINHLLLHLGHRCEVRNTEVRNTRINTRITYYEIWTRSTERTADC